MTLTNKQIEELRKNHKILKIEIDERHRAALKDVYNLGIEAGRQRAKSSIEWRTNGDLWASFIDKDEHAS